MWLQAIYLICSSKKGISTRQIQRTLGGSMKTAWFLMHRIREAMSDGSLEPFGGGGGDVEADETFIGHDANYSARGGKNMNVVLSLVDRETGRVRSLVLDNVTTSAATAAVAANVDPDTRLLTDCVQPLSPRRRADDRPRGRQSLGRRVRPPVRSDRPHEHRRRFFQRLQARHARRLSALRRKHLHRYLAEFDFRYSYRVALGVDDKARAERALDGVAGKRLTYETVSQRRPPMKSASSGKRRWFTKPHRSAWP